VYDTMQLTAAHPTMPLPSYARVTNLETGSSIIVRVNDRGPYHEGRIIDVSERAAQMLDYGKVGTARVKVEYVGRAPLDGNDDQYLMASYRPGNRRP
ncbi:MAG: septal ring lytic transglycosylase RlpA family protein, partial [Mesorhizobium sp.]